MLKFLILILLSQAVFAQKISVDERRKRILSIVDEELSEVSRLAKQQDFKSPDTILRLSELNLEKARHWREMENEQFLSIPAEKRRTVNKSKYFSQSNKYFEAANESAMKVVKRFPKYKGLGDVYYILAYNNKELGRHDSAQKYFKLATAKTNDRSQVGLKSRVNLADYYFNDHKYKKAIPLYESSLNKLDEKWWTKDSFNLAWCYYRTRNYDRAISLMKEVHKKSSDSKYIDMRSNVERDIGVFFVDAGRMNDAIKFYEGLGLNYTEQFIKIANAITTQGRFAQAESLLYQAAKNEKDRERRIEILIAQLNLLDKYAKIAAHLQTCKELVFMHQKQTLSSDHLKTLTFHVNKKAAELQKSTASNLYEKVPKVRKEKAAQSIAYFELSAILTPGDKFEKVFFQGETAFAAKQYEKALGLYITSFDGAKSASNKKIMSQSLEGMLSALGQDELSKSSANKYYESVYTRYLTVDNSSDRAKSIYTKLFNTQYDAGDMNGAEKTMADFAKSFPRDFETQEGMLAKVMEHYRKKKDYGAVKAYVVRINEGDFKVSKKYADALRSLMTKIQIEGVQQSLMRGEKGTALKGYHQIYESSESTPKAKTNAAYNLAALYYEMGDSTSSYNWSAKAVRDMEVAEVNKFADSLLSIAAGLFLKQQFSQSADLSYRLLAKLCKENSSNKSISYKNAIYISLANGDLNKALEIRNFGKECMIPDQIITEVSLEIVKDLGKEKRWEQSETILRELEVNSKNYPMLIKPYEDLRIEYSKVGDVEKSREIEIKINKFFAQSKSQKLDIPVEALDLLANKMLVNVTTKKQRLDQLQLQFPENVFNNTVKTKLQILDQLTSEVNAIQKLGSGKGIVEAYRHVITAYEEFGISLKNFIPEGKSPEYVQSFQKAMSEVYNPILTNARKLRGEIKKLITDNKILSESNPVVLNPAGEGYKRFITSQEAVLMERVGRR